MALGNMLDWGLLLWLDIHVGRILNVLGSGVLRSGALLLTLRKDVGISLGLHASRVHSLPLSSGINASTDLSILSIPLDRAHLLRPRIGINRDSGTSLDRSLRGLLHLSIESSTNAGQNLTLTLASISVEGLLFHLDESFDRLEIDIREVATGEIQLVLILEQRHGQEKVFFGFELRGRGRRGN